MRLRILSVAYVVLALLSSFGRDGGFSANGDFPNSYLYSQNGNIEWRF